MRYYAKDLDDDEDEDEEPIQEEEEDEDEDEEEPCRWVLSTNTKEIDAEDVL